MITYGKGIKSTADELKISEEEAQKLLDNFFNTFPKIKKFMEDSQNMAKEYGYVETLWGRKRRIPDMQLPQYTFENLIIAIG